MTQVDKRGLHYQVLGLMVLVLFSGFGDTKEELDDVLQYNTTYDGGSGEQPRVLAIQRPCGPEHEGFCFNGVCSYSTELKIPICRCNQLYSGVRCEHLVLESYHISSPEEVIGISCGVTLLLASIIGLMYFCLQKRCRKSSLPYKNYGSENSV
ncbi:epigen [Ctenopharyngodon idella]|uniref:epigen n=1 Tax=Ctenopharyngodon idella TaxID=7959 RepID=UPI002230C2A7|nr:epigen [Ctenopharyngodon idella]